MATNNSINNYSETISLDYPPSYKLKMEIVDSAMADRILSWTFGDADRAITLSGNPTLADWFNQSVKTTASPSFTNLTILSGGLTLNASYLFSTGGTNNFLVGTNSTDILNFQSYDVDGTQYRTFASLSAGNTPSFVFSQPSGGLLRWDGGEIGGITPAAITGTALKETTSYTSSRTATAVSANATSTITGVTSNASARTITLLTADLVSGRIKIIKDEAGTAASANNISIATEGGELIDGIAASNFKITANYGVLRFYSNGTNWFSW